MLGYILGVVLAKTSIDNVKDPEPDQAIASDEPGADGTSWHSSFRRSGRRNPAAAGIARACACTGTQEAASRSTGGVRTRCEGCASGWNRPSKGRSPPRIGNAIVARIAAGLRKHFRDLSSRGV